MHAERLEDQVGEREELWKAIEGLRLAEPSDVTGFTEIDRARLTFGSGMPLVRRRGGGEGRTHVVPLPWVIRPLS